MGGAGLEPTASGLGNLRSVQIELAAPSSSSDAVSSASSDDSSSEDGEPPSTGELWRPVVGYEGLYEVSSLARVRRARAHRQWPAGRLLKPQGRYDGRVVVGLRRDGRSKIKLVHVLVAEAFIGPRPPGREVNHRDGDKFNNLPGNLEWTTRLENVRHANAIGIGKPFRAGSAHPQRRLTEKVVAGLRMLAASQELDRGFYARWAKRYGVTRSAIHGAINGRSWTHVRAPATELP